MSLPKGMRRCRKARLASGPGDAWFYVSPKGLEVYVSEDNKSAASHCFTISRRQLKRSVEIIEKAKEQV